MGERSEGIAGGVEYAFDIVLLRHVTLDRDRIAARPLYSVNDAGSSMRIGLVIDRHIVTPRARERRGSCSDSPAAAGDKQDWSRHELLPDFAWQFRLASATSRQRRNTRQSVKAAQLRKGSATDPRQSPRRPGPPIEPSERH